jgi:hypothetical protein
MNKTVVTFSDPQNVSFTLSYLTILAQTLQDTKIVYIPHLVAVVGKIPPPTKMGVDSVQKERKDEIVDMDEFKISWEPYIPHGFPKSKNDSKVFFMRCKMRDARKKNMALEAVMRYNYLLPYFKRPSELLLDTEEQSVPFYKLVEGCGVSIKFDLKDDDINDAIQEAIEDHPTLEHSKDRERHIAELEKDLRKAVDEEQNRQAQVREVKQQEYDAFDKDLRTALE